MPRFLRNALLNLRDFALTFGPFVLLAAGLLWAAFTLLQPTPPQTVTLASGQPQGAYAEFGRQYAASLARHGIEVKLRETQGAAENLALLRDPASGVSIAFVQGGADDRGRQPNADRPDDDLVSLGSLFHEPLWLFYRQDAAHRLLGRGTLASLAELRGWRLNIGPPGSGVPNLLDSLFQANGIAEGDVALHRLRQAPAVDALLAGALDAIAFASAPTAPVVQQLLRTEGIALLDFAQAEAYSRRFPFLSTVVLPRGIVNLAEDLPPRDIRLIAPTATLVATEDLHPALIQLFMQAARSIHGGPGWFQRGGDFPSERAVEWPLAAESERFLRNGQPWLQRYLPFWLANLIDRMWLALVSIIAVLIPLSRVLPPLYEFRVRSRIFRWYAQLRKIEDELSDPENDRSGLVAQLDELDARVERIAVPLSHTDALYALRSHIRLVRNRLAPDAAVAADSDVETEMAAAPQTGSVQGKA
jgi:TRAP transporter TAXI family solute receptor